jgi:hypothetical protein
VILVALVRFLDLFLRDGRCVGRKCAVARLRECGIGRIRCGNGVVGGVALV